MNANIIEQIDKEIATLQLVKSYLQETPVKRGVGRPKRVNAQSVATKQVRGKRKLSAEGKARIAAAQKARWAKARKAAK